MYIRKRSTINAKLAVVQRLSDFMDKAKLDIIQVSEGSKVRPSQIAHHLIALRTNNADGQLPNRNTILLYEAFLAEWARLLPGHKVPKPSDDHLGITQAPRPRTLGGPVEASASSAASEQPRKRHGNSPRMKALIHKAEALQHHRDAEALEKKHAQQSLQASQPAGLPALYVSLAALVLGALALGALLGKYTL